MILPDPVRLSPQDYRRFVLNHPDAGRLLEAWTFTHEGETLPFIEKTDSGVEIYVAMLSDEQQRKLGLSALNELKRHRSAQASPIWKYAAGVGAAAILAAGIFFFWEKPPAPDGFEPTPAPAILPTATPAPNATPTPTIKPTRTPNATPTPTIKPTRTPNATPTPKATATPTPEPTAAPTDTPIPTATPKPNPTRPSRVSVREIVLKGENGALIPLLAEQCLVKPGERLSIERVALDGVSAEEIALELSAAGQGRIDKQAYIAPNAPGASVPLTIHILWKPTGEQLASKGILVKTQREQ